jgi:hypothetical protein
MVKYRLGVDADAEECVGFSPQVLTAVELRRIGDVRHASLAAAQRVHDHALHRHQGVRRTILIETVEDGVRVRDGLTVFQFGDGELDRITPAGEVDEDPTLARDGHAGRHRSSERRHGLDPSDRLRRGKFRLVGLGGDDQGQQTETEKSDHLRMLHMFHALPLPGYRDDDLANLLVRFQIAVRLDDLVGGNCLTLVAIAAVNSERLFASPSIMRDAISALASAIPAAAAIIRRMLRLPIARLAPSRRDSLAARAGPHYLITPSSHGCLKIFAMRISPTAKRFR